MKIYTKTGDDGTTQLIGGERVPKYDLRVETYGAIDELMSFVGLLHDQPDMDSQTAGTLQTIQQCLMTCASIYATSDNVRKPTPSLCQADICAIEKAIDNLSAQLEPLTQFVLPGGNTTVSLCHVCRSICRRTERIATKLSAENDQRASNNSLANKYLNRLSDYLFVLSRYFEKKLNVEQILWQPNID